MKSTILATVLLAETLSATTQTTLAQGTVYTSRISFEQQLSSSTTITMETLPPSTAADVAGGQGKNSITVAGVSFVVAPSPTLFVANPSRAYPIPGDGQYIFNYDSFSPVSILLPSGVTAFGADFAGGFNPTYDATLTVSLSGGTGYTYSFSGPSSSWTFFGVTFSEPIASVIFSDASGPAAPVHEEALDNVIYGTAIPEPSALAFFALGVALFGGRFLRKRPGWFS